MMAMENATREEESVEAQVDVVRLASGHLKKNTSACVWITLPTTGKVRRDAITKHKHGSEHCISAFLGDKNWSRQKISDLLRLEDKLDKSVLKTLRTDRRSDHKTSLGQQASS